MSRLLLLLLTLTPWTAESLAQSENSIRDDFSGSLSDKWQVTDGEWRIVEGHVHADGVFGKLLLQGKEIRDFEASADVAYLHDAPHAAVGIQFRLAADGSGYAAGLREIEKGNDPQFGPWERPVLQLFRIDKDGWKLLQESKVPDCRSGVMRRLKVLCQGPNIFVYYEDMAVPVLKEFDDTYDRAGRLGLWKDVLGAGNFDNFSLAQVTSVPPPPLRTDWSAVRGAIYVRSNAVNAVEMWHDYWPHTDMLDRELSYASLYGFNMIQVYLHWIVWDHHKEEYLRRIDDFLARAAKYGLKCNLIFWDDCGHVEPGLTFAAPVSGRHNSQMMPNPSHRIRNSEAELLAHKKQFQGYVEGVARHFKNDPRISFWQIYNECMGPKERYRQGEADRNLNLLLEWTRTWIKATGDRTPVTATGGGFYGPKYSDFYTYHSYSGPGQPLPNADGGPEHLCTETLNRPNANLMECLRGLAGKQNGFVVWELMIGRDNCRFPWGHPDGLDEPAQPFHGVIFPDGHPWSLEEIKALMGEANFSAMQKRVFKVEYFQGSFETAKKTSITPRIHFDLGDEPGYGSPDAAAGISNDHFSIRWTAEFAVSAAGTYTFYGEADGDFSLWIDETQVLGKTARASDKMEGRIELKPQHTYRLKAQYLHGTGSATAHLHWSGPGFQKGIFQPSSLLP